MKCTFNVYFKFFQQMKQHFFIKGLFQVTFYYQKPHLYKHDYFFKSYDFLDYFNCAISKHFIIQFQCLKTFYNVIFHFKNGSFFQYYAHAND
jgi:hypothetical protein